VLRADLKKPQLPLPRMQACCKARRM
jgi:hypothetical protein